MFFVAGQDCSVLISADQRRDCYPWQIDGSSDGRDKCTARGCIWCDQGDGSIACYYDDTVSFSLHALVVYLYSKHKVQALNKYIEVHLIITNCQIPGDLHT